MKSSFPINGDKRSTSSSWNGRRLKRDVSRIVIRLIKDKARASCDSLTEMPTKTEEYARPATPPDSSSLSTVRDAAKECTACHLYKRATQTVFGEGPKKAPIMLVGEQPGDYEDVAGKPFVGPAGKIMDRALEEAGIDRKEVYVTNAVKHFKWEPRGKRRIHQKPNSREVAACRPWLEAELRIVRPKLLVVLSP